MELVDTHCHIHFEDYKLDPDEVIREANAAHVTRLICVGCTLEDSETGVDFVQTRDNCWASIGLHPHEGAVYADNPDTLERFAKLATKPKVVAIGETGLDYYYNHSPKRHQVAILEFQLDLAQKHQLPVIFHVREAFNDFWPVFDNFPGLRGVVHSFTAHVPELEQILSRGLYVGLNGIMTFTKDQAQIEVAKAVPLQKLLIETDAPFLTPSPFRGTICQPKHIGVTSEFLSNLRGESLEQLAVATTKNARELFSI
jgi:TatD DNase family protein